MVFAVTLKLEGTLWMSLGALLACGVSAWGAYASYHRFQLLENTPTSKVRSASQGFAEVAGVAMCPASETDGVVLSESNVLTAPISGRPCIWWRVSVYKSRSSKFGRGPVLDSTTNSATAVAVQDETGKVIFFPIFARMDHFESTRLEDDNIIEVEELVFHGQTIYVAGQFKTISFPLFRTLAWKACREASTQTGGAIVSKIWSRLKQFFFGSSWLELDVQPTRDLLSNLQSQSAIHILSKAVGIPLVVSARGESNLKKGLLFFVWVNGLAMLFYVVVSLFILNLRHL